MTITVLCMPAMADPASGEAIGADLNIRKLELDTIARVRRNELIASVVHGAFKWCSLGLIPVCAYLTLTAYAGKETFANVSLQGVINVSTVCSLTLGAAVIGVVFGRRYKKLHGNTVEQMHKRVKNLELQIDPNRTSSGLTPRGDTPPEDRLW